MSEIMNIRPKNKGEEAVQEKKTNDQDTDAGAAKEDTSWFPSGDSSKKRQQDNTELVGKGTIPDASFASEELDVSSGTVRSWIANKLASDDEKQLIKDYNNLAKRVGQEPLNDSQKLQIANLPEDLKKMYRKTLHELVDLKDGKISSAQYMANTLTNAADLAEATDKNQKVWDHTKPSRAELFKNYIALVMSEKPMGFFKDIGRELAGGGPDLAGSALESVYQKIISDGSGNIGFNSNITDVSNSNSVTHHFREFFVVGYNSGKFLADKAATTIDDPNENPGDVRDGYFAGMIGAALANGNISARDAANLTIWAYTQHGGTQPPWGAKAEKGKHLDRIEHYDIAKWLKAYRARKD